MSNTHVCHAYHIGHLWHVIMYDTNVHYILPLVRHGTSDVTTRIVILRESYMDTRWEIVTTSTFNYQCEYTVLGAYWDDSVTLIRTPPFSPLKENYT